MIEVRDVYKKYFIGTPNEMCVLKGMSMVINDGEFVAIVGQSGSGKSTLMNILGALDTPTEGDYLIDGVSSKDLTQDMLSEVRSKEIGFIFQKFHLIPRTSALDNVQLPTQYTEGANKKEVTARAKELLTMVGMDTRMHHMPNELSGGQQQRVAVARALINNPKILLADEPTGALDTKTGIQIMDIFKKINREDGKTVILITHNDELAQEADRIITIADGEIVNERKGAGAK